VSLGPGSIPLGSFSPFRIFDVVSFPFFISLRCLLVRTHVHRQSLKRSLYRTEIFRLLNFAIWFFLFSVPRRLALLFVKYFLWACILWMTFLCLSIFAREVHVFPACLAPLQILAVVRTFRQDGAKWAGHLGGATTGGQGMKSRNSNKQHRKTCVSFFSLRAC
jgi:hypothetical protein